MITLTSLGIMEAVKRAMKLTAAFIVGLGSVFSLFYF